MDSPATKFDADAIALINQALAKQTPQVVLEWCLDNLTDLFQVSSFQPSGMVIMDMLHKMGRQVPTIFLDTLHHFPETVAHAKRAEQKYGAVVHWHRCEHASTREEFEQMFGQELWLNDTKKYDYLTKVRPLELALSFHNVGAWITGRRRDHGGLRAALPIIEIDESDGRIKVNPLASWTNKDVWNYIVPNNVIYNPLHDLGYNSIGDCINTRPTGSESGERSGRFYQTQGKTECGIHIKKEYAPSTTTQTAF
jgi:phosphoadenosine phosphosulfate reductase